MEDYIRNIQEQWLKSLKTLAGITSRNSADLFSDIITIGDGQFFLELLQNAEDARMELGETGGYFSLKLTREAVEVRHNGKPFDREDVRRICMIGSSKKPKRLDGSWI